MTILNLSSLLLAGPRRFCVGLIWMSSVYISREDDSRFSRVGPQRYVITVFVVVHAHRVNSTLGIYHTIPALIHMEA